MGIPLGVTVDQLAQMNPMPRLQLPSGAEDYRKYPMFEPHCRLRLLIERRCSYFKKNYMHTTPLCQGWQIERL